MKLPDGRSIHCAVNLMRHICSSRPPPASDFRLIGIVASGKAILSPAMRNAKGKNSAALVYGNQRKL